MNVPKTCALLIGARMATLHELQTVYGTEDMYNLLEILAVDRYNEKLAQEKT